MPNTWIKMGCLLFCLSFHVLSNATGTIKTDVDPNKPIKILSLDSGGIHGIISAHSLYYLEKKSGKSIHELFDLIVCTSTGAIEAAILTLPNPQGNPNYSSQQLLYFYNHEIATLLRTPLWWRIVSLKGLIRPELNSDAVYALLNQWCKNYKLSDLLNHVVIVTYNLDTNWIIQFDNQAAKGDPSKDFKLVDVLYGAISAPTKIGPRAMNNLTKTKSYTLVDGAVMSTDPAEVGLIVATKLYPNNPKYILSLGNGMQPPIIDSKQVKNWGLLSWAEPLISTLMTARTNLSQKLMYLMYHENALNLKYYARINVELPHNAAGSFGSSPQQINLLNQIGQQLVEQHRAQLDFFANTAETPVPQD